MKFEGGGTGIGLSLARDMAHILHGEIIVESEPGKGSIFTVSLPLGKNHLKESEFILMKDPPECINSLLEIYDNTENSIAAAGKYTPG